MFIVQPLGKLVKQPCVGVLIELFTFGATTMIETLGGSKTYAFVSGPHTVGSSINNKLS